MMASKPELTMEAKLELKIESKTGPRIEPAQPELAQELGRTKRPSQRPEPSGNKTTDDVRTLSVIIFFFL